MSSTAEGAGGRSGQLRCGCCGRTLPARRLTELGNTPGVYICPGCAFWAARRTVRLPELRRLAHRVAHEATTAVRRDDGRTFRSAIPILPSADIERTIEFWGAVGFEVVERYDGYLLTHGDGVELHFTIDTGGAEPGSGTQPRPGSAFVHVRDASALWKRLRSADVPGLGPVEDRDYGLREFVVTDPDGNTVRFGSPVPR